MIKYFLLLFLITCGCAKPFSLNCGTVGNSKVYGIVKLAYPSNPEFINPLKAAAETWNKAVGYSLIQVGSTGASVVSLSPWPYAYNSQASTEIIFNQSWITNYRISINEGYFSIKENPTTYEIDAESLFLHEIGHVLGFPHSPEVKTGVMSPTLQVGYLRRTLDPYSLNIATCAYSKNNKQ